MKYKKIEDLRKRSLLVNMFSNKFFIVNRESYRQQHISKKKNVHITFLINTLALAL